jgi:hypothetical protein
MSQPMKTEAYYRLKNSIRDLYPNGLSEAEADEATRNLIGFAKLLLEIRLNEEVESKHG